MTSQAEDCTQDAKLARRAKVLRSAFAACSASLVLSACGPGVVGTGGPVTSAATLSVSNLCSTPLATALNCTPATGAGSPSGNVTTTWADTPSDTAPASVSAQITNTTIVLQVRCSGLRFEGTWSALSDGSVAFYGTWTSTSQTQGAPGILRVSLADSGSGWEVRVTLHDANDTAIQGPWLLRRALVVNPAACP